MEFSATDGYLLVADISGYTAFLASTELEHAHAIVRELTALVRRELAPPLRFVKLEGDAVLCYADGTVFRDGERFIEVIEASYYAFVNRLDDMALATTCGCRACQAIGSLDLKFIAHYGNFIVDEDDGREDLAGSDVILVHRLLKNTIALPSAYVFFTDACLQHLPSGIDLPPHTETYDALGPITGGVYDLRPVMAAMREARSERLTAEDADLEIVADFPTIPAVVWQYFVDPVERQRWVCLEFSAEPDAVIPNAVGRVGPGAVSHCSHGPGTWFREILDWRPLTYFTCRTVAPGAGPPDARSVVNTVELRALAGGTRVANRFRLVDRATETVDAFRQLSPSLERGLREAYEVLRRVIDADAAAPAP